MVTQRPKKLLKGCFCFLQLGWRKHNFPELRLDKALFGVWRSAWEAAFKHFRAVSNATLGTKCASMVLISSRSSCLRWCVKPTVCAERTFNLSILTMSVPLCRRTPGNLHRSAEWGGSPETLCEFCRGSSSSALRCAVVSSRLYLCTWILKTAAHNSWCFYTRGSGLVNSSYAMHVSRRSVLLPPVAALRPFRVYTSVFSSLWSALPVLELCSISLLSRCLSFPGCSYLLSMRLLTFACVYPVYHIWKSFNSSCFSSSASSQMSCVSAWMSIDNLLPSTLFIVSLLKGSFIDLHSVTGERIG